MKRKLLYIHVGLSSFVKKDIEILSSEFELKTFYFNLTSKKKLPLSFLKQFFFLCRTVFYSKTIVVQFAGYQSFLPVIISKLLNKKVIIILGGTDCVGFPSIQYGCFYNTKLKFFTAFSLRKANLLLPVDQTLVEYDYTYQNEDYPKQGYAYHVPNIKTPFKVIYNGYDALKWNPGIKEENSFVTVGADFTTKFGVKLKGIDLILSIAPKFPNCKFYIVGGNTIDILVPENVELIDFIPNEKLGCFLATKQFYLQLSMSEGFPNALCESMLCGCIPIVSNVGAMPMIAQETGFVLLKKDLNLLKSLIIEAISDNDLDSRSLHSRKFISENFTIKNRQNQLIKEINSLMN